MARPIPKNMERAFQSEELFFSTTNAKGIIQDGNNVFVKISGYPLEKMMGAPHNIIRHPDMPKAVFKLLWDTIKANQPIAAYVKNLAADGCYYWVLAFVFPIGDSYLSIRLKPTTPLRSAAESIYAAVLAEEKSNGVEASANLMMSLLEGAGFSDYDHFMATAVLSEIKSRDAALQSNTSFLDRSKEGAAASKIYSFVADVSNRYRAIFERIEAFDAARSVFENKTGDILGQMENFQLLALNMRVFASRLGPSSASLGVVAKNFQELVDNIDKYFQTFSRTAHSLSDGMEKTILDIGALKIQMDMVDFFVRDSIKKSNLSDLTSPELFRDLKRNSQMFIGLSEGYEESAKKRMFVLKAEVEKFLVLSKDIKKIINNLEYITNMGAIETSKMISGKEDFSHYIEKMVEFGTILRSGSRDIGHAVEDILYTLADTELALNGVCGGIREVFKLGMEAASDDSIEMESAV